MINTVEKFTNVTTYPINFDSDIEKLKNISYNNLSYLILIGYIYYSSAIEKIKYRRA